MTEADSNSAAPLCSYERPLSTCRAATPMRHLQRASAVVTAASKGETGVGPVVAHAAGRERQGQDHEASTPHTPPP